LLGETEVAKKGRRGGRRPYSLFLTVAQLRKKYKKRGGKVTKRSKKKKGGRINSNGQKKRGKEGVVAPAGESRRKGKGSIHLLMEEKGVSCTSPSRKGKGKSMSCSSRGGRGPFEFTKSGKTPGGKKRENRSGFSRKRKNTGLSTRGEGWRGPTQRGEGGEGRDNSPILGSEKKNNMKEGETFRNRSITRDSERHLGGGRGKASILFSGGEKGEDRIRLHLVDLTKKEKRKKDVL